MDQSLLDQILEAWSKNNSILLYLLSEIPDKHLSDKPQGSRGRTISRQLEHLCKIRKSWIHFQKSGEHLKFPKQKETTEPTEKALQEFIQNTGKEVYGFLSEIISEGKEMRMFNKNPFRFMAYLIAHESHHRGQILLALKQNGFKAPEKMAIQGLWGKWIFGK